MGFTRDPATGEIGRLRRLPGQRPGRGRRGGHPQHAAAGTAWRPFPRDLRRATRDLRRGSSCTTATCSTPSSRSTRASSGCCRPASASAPALPRSRMAVEMTDDGLRSRGPRRCQRVTAGAPRPGAPPAVRRRTSQVLATGLAAFRPAPVWPAYFTADRRPPTPRPRREGRPRASGDLPDDVHGMAVAEAILTLRGWLEPCRGRRPWMGKPAVVRGRKPRIEGNCSPPPATRSCTKAMSSLSTAPPAKSCLGEVPLADGSDPRGVRDHPRVGRRDSGRATQDAGQRRQRRRTPTKLASSAPRASASAARSTCSWAIGSRWCNA